MKTETVWVYNPPCETAKKLSKELGLPLTFSQILVNRKIKDTQEAQRFLHGTLDDLHDPLRMKGMEIAVERINKAIASGEKIFIFGDYDVDGILSLVALTRALESLGGKVEHYIPDRLKKGYGIKEEYIDIVLEKKASLVISVDCGMRAGGFVLRAAEEGIDVIITDHHLPGPDLPKALCVLNPVLESADYPDKKLAGIGVAFKLIQALMENRQRSAALPHYLKLVAIATIADIAELRGENRLFVKYGLKGLEQVSNIGLSSLLGVCGLKGKKVGVGDVGFRIGPRINAAGRLGMTDLVVDLFFSESESEAIEIASKLDSLNLKRQKIEAKILNQALAQIKDKMLDEKYKLFILGCDQWHRGVIGIVASKLKDLYNRPVILFSYDDGRAAGSGRSIPSFSLIDCLEASKEHFINYGGHTLAVGCELEQRMIPGLKHTVNAYTSSAISEDHLKKKIYADSQISFTEIDSGFLKNLDLLSPYGVGNSRPVFLTNRAVLSEKPNKIHNKHSKMILKNDGRWFEALGWNRPEWSDMLSQGDVVDVVFSLQKSEFMGEQKYSLSILDIKPSS